MLYWVKIKPNIVEFFQAEHDTWSVCQARIDQYMAGGVQLCWLVDISERVAYIFRQGQKGVTATIGYSGELNGEDIVPGFKTCLKSLYERHLNK